MPVTPPCRVGSQAVAQCSLWREGPGWERGMLWAPGPLSLGDCKIPMYITVAVLGLGALECNKARRTGLFPGTVVPLGEVHPSTVGCVGFVFGGRKHLQALALPHPCPVREKRGAGARA